MRKLAVLAAIVGLGSLSAWAGTAYYGGLTGETGIPLNSDGLTAGEISGGAYFNWVPNGDGTWDINSNAGRKKGTFTLGDGTTPMSITDPPAASWTAAAGIDVPGSGQFQDYDDPAPTSNYRFYFGTELGPYDKAGNDQCGIMGIEWNTGLGAFALRSDSNGLIGDSSDAGGDQVVGIPANSQRFEVRVSKNTAGDLTPQYRVNYGAWQSFPTPAPTITVPISDALLTAFLADSADPDTAAFSIRGSFNNVKASFTGGSVPDVNTGLDQDGDGANNDVDAFPGDADYEADTDADGLPDEWETLLIGNLSENGYSNNDGDFINNFQEFAGGFDPTLQDGPGLPAVGTMGRVLMISALALLGLGAVAFRFRKAHAH